MTDQTNPNEEQIFREFAESIGGEAFQQVLTAVVTLDDGALAEAVRSREDPVHRLTLAYVGLVWRSRVKIALGEVNYNDWELAGATLQCAAGQVPVSAVAVLADIPDEQVEQLCKELVDQGLFDILQAPSDDEGGA